MLNKERRVVDSSRDQQASGEIGGDKKAQKGAEARREPETVRQEIAGLEKKFQGYIDIYREKIKFRNQKKLELEKDMNLLQSFREKGTSKMSDKEFEGHKQAAAEEIEGLTYSAENYKRDAKDIDQEIDKLKGELDDLEKRSELN